MIITQTPLRISFFGGGTDFPDFFHQEPGWVLSSAIDKYIFVTIKERFDDHIRVGYTQTELVDCIVQIEHDIVRECLRLTGIHKGVEINTMGDIPSEGSGLGSSSTVTVGLLHAMYAYLGTPKDHETLAREACHIELNVLKKPIGIQDQYIAAYGGQRFIQFLPGDEVIVEALDVESQTIRHLNQHLMLFYTNSTRKAEVILKEQQTNINATRDVLREMKTLASTARQCLLDHELNEFGTLMHRSWLLKKTLSSKISNPAIEDIYQTALCAGALGGKIAGAGGGGFLLLYCPPNKQEAVRQALHHLPELMFRLERDGTKVIFNYRR